MRFVKNCFFLIFIISVNAAFSQAYHGGECDGYDYIEFRANPNSADHTENTNIQLQVYPNPASNGTPVTLHWKSEDHYITIQITNLEGLVWFHGDCSKKFTIKSLSKGIYLIKVISNHQTLTQKLIVL